LILTNKSKQRRHQ